jgi:uncharacterized protein (DUF362 family)/Pyruvate/2-oxoacid:ferredoxin oxidoreductase delta subunit
VSRARVSIVRCRSYQSSEVDAAVSQAIELIGGAARFIPQSGELLLKPNLLGPVSREKRATTDPEVARAVAETLRTAGATKISLGDSPAVASASLVMRRNGYNGVLPEWVERVAFSAGRPHPTASHKDLELAAPALDADAIVNLPKLKTHAYMGLTLGVKNMFGTVVGARKAQWHLRAGENRALFARLIVEICYALHPALTVVDGVIGMEGNGPANGTPRELGVIIAGDDPAAVDTVIARMLGYDADDLPVLAECRRSGMGVTDLEEIELAGESLSAVAISDFQRAHISEGIGIGIGGPLARMLKRALTNRPLIHDDLCKLCGQCAEICPPDAINMDAAAGRKPVIDRGKCIRCFCCQEICPHNAISVRAGWLLRLLSLFRRG